MRTFRLQNRHKIERVEASVAAVGETSEPQQPAQAVVEPHAISSGPTGSSQDVVRAASPDAVESPRLQNMGTAPPTVRLRE
jgi:hypothetical protein